MRWMPLLLALFSLPALAGEDRANAEIWRDGTPEGIDSRWVRFHWGEENIDETQTDPSWFGAARTNARSGMTSTEWSTWVLANVAPTVSFTWSSDWTTALRRALAD